MDQFQNLDSAAVLCVGATTVKQTTTYQGQQTLLVRKKNKNR